MPKCSTEIFGKDFSNILTLRMELANRVMECLSVDGYICESLQVLL